MSAFLGQDGFEYVLILSSGEWEWAHTLPGPFNTGSFESQPLTRDKTEEICGFRCADTLGTDSLRAGTDESPGRRKVFAFLRGPPEQRY